MLRPDAQIKCLRTVCQGHVNSLDLSDMRGLLDYAAGEGGPHSAALPQSRGRSSDTHPVYYSGPRNREGLSGADLSCASTGHGYAALVCCAALSLGQVSQSHGSVDLPPALINSSLLTSSVLLPVPVNTLQKQLYIKYSALSNTISPLSWVNLKPPPPQKKTAEAQF